MVNRCTTCHTPFWEYMYPFHRLPSIRLLLFTVLFSIFVPSTLHAQWEYLKSYRYGYELSMEGRQGQFFFPSKDPEEQEVTLGPVVVRPGLGVSETYSNNITLQKTDKKEDFFTNLFPAVLFHLPFRQHNFEME